MAGWRDDRTKVCRGTVSTALSRHCVCVPGAGPLADVWGLAKAGGCSVGPASRRLSGRRMTTQASYLRVTSRHPPANTRGCEPVALTGKPRPRRRRAAGEATDSFRVIGLILALGRPSTTTRGHANSAWTERQRVSSILLSDGPELSVSRRPVQVEPLGMAPRSIESCQAFVCWSGRLTRSGA